MRIQALVPALALVAALLASPPAQADGRHRSERGRGRQAHGAYDRHGGGSHGYRPSHPHGYAYGYQGHGYRPYYRPRVYAPPPAYYGYGYGSYYGAYGYGGYGDYGYYPPPPPPPYYRPRPRVGVGIWLGF